ncbi:MAG: ABC transporter substrate-binding protein/permease, partial [Lachnospiraceae bacterium]|nr:ABC transporter substrate-binding protein/permease [Lachnospiraceae bacterium]
VVRDCFVTAKSEKGKKLQREFNSYLKTIRENGKYDEFLKKWTEGEPGEKDTERYDFDGKNGEINVCTCGDWTPMSYYAGDKLVGFFIEMVKDFSYLYGYKPNFFVCNYKSEIAGISSGLYDFLADVVDETEERKQEVNLTDVVYEQTILAFTKGEQNNRIKISRLDKFISDLKESFDKTFIKEGRWKLLLRGLKTTILISIFSGIFGTILGAIVCICRMSTYPILTAIGRIYIKVIQGTPIVVMLLFLYYLVFANASFDAYYVCVIGFSIDFSAYVSEIFRSGIESVPKGQYKAAIALGFGKIGAFVYVVLPQSLIYILPVFVGQFVSMVKITSVAGYISVEDLTKASDLIRSRTYEAFFPIVLTAIIYFVISNLLTLVLKRLTEIIIPYSKINKRKEVKSC